MIKTSDEYLIRSWMKYNADRYDIATNLAEHCAWALAHDEWLDDPDHIIWDISLQYINNDV